MTQMRLLLIQTAAGLHSAHPQHANRLLRDKKTGLPFIRPASVLGALRKQMRDALYSEYSEHSDWKTLANADPRILNAFGSVDAKGPFTAGQARPLFFPVRALKGTFVWITSAQLLSDFARVLNENLALPELKEFDARCAESCKALNAGEHLLLEELGLSYQGDLTELMAWMKNRLQGMPFLDEISERLVLVSDRVMQHFTSFGLSAQARRNPETGRLEHLEALPENTWLYSPLELPDAAHWEQLPPLPKRIYLGSHRAMGYGLCRVSVYTHQSHQQAHTAVESTLESEQEAA